MRVKINDKIKEVDDITIRTNDIQIGIAFYQTGDRTKELGEQLLTKGYIDLTGIECYRP